MLYLGDFATNGIVDFKFNVADANGLATTRSTAGTIRVYKDNSTTERTSSNGITDTASFDSITGVAHVRVDLSDNTDSGFYAAGHEYQVVLNGAAIGSTSVNAVLAHFSIESANTYQAKAWLQDDDTGTADRYVAAWFKNGEPILSGITATTVQVIKAADGTDLVAAAAMTSIGSTGAFRYVEASNRIVDGAAYLIKLQATIDSSTRSWLQPIGRDS